MFPSETSEHQRLGLQQVFATGLPRYAESETQFPDQIKWLGTWLTPIKDEAGAVTAVLGIARDITDHKHAEEALRERERTWATLISNLPGFVYRCANDLDWTMEYISEGCRDITGYVPEDFLQNRTLAYNDIIHANYQELLWQKWQEVLPRRETFEGEYPIFTASGEARWVWERGQGIYAEDGRLLYLEGFITDITARKRAEEALKRRAAQLALLSEVGSKIAAVRELQNVLDTTARLIHEYFGYHHVALFTTNRERGELTMAARAGEFVNLFPPDHRLKLGQGLVGWVGLHGELLLANDVRAEPRYVNFYADILPTQSELTVPLQVAQENVGVLDVQSPQLNAFDENDVLVIKTLADQIAVAIENARLYEAVRQELADRTRTEEALRTSEAFNQAIIQNSPIGISVRSRTGRLLSANDAWKKIWAIPEAAVLEDTGRQRQTLEFDTRDDDLKPNHAELRRVYEQGGYLHLPELKITHPRPGAAEWITQHFYALTDAQGQVDHVVVLTEDITERKQHERELEALVTVAAALRAAPTRGDMLPVIVDQAMSLLTAEAAALIMPSPTTNDNVFVLARGTWTDWTGAHLPIGRGVTDHVLTVGQPIMRGGESIPGILWLDRVGEIPLAACVPLIADSHVMAALWVGRRDDLTAAELRRLMAMADIAANALHRAGILETLERRVAERTRELSVANEQLKELDRAKDQFVSNVSHELRTPLANLKLYLALLDRGKPEKRAEYMQTLHREQQRLDKMIEDLLDLSRLDLGVTQIQPVPTDLNLLLSQLIADRAALAAEHQLTLDYQPDDDLPLALIDPVLLTEVITNLLGNAINYTPASGVITVITDVREHEDQTWVTFTVQDNGFGISAGDLPHLFERFYRGEVGRKANAPGTGLGLAISQEIVVKMGGRITVESDGVPGHGAAFTVWLRPAN